ncbi:MULTISPECIES: hypothetical protein [Pandoraea]|uniref:hypothetical protein n=1 Tax=Pandoraea TaxID=93217 RepID=UPI001F5DB445|nr:MULTISPECIES: hypothetical protein [Pandoraea]MCI3206572.1 hypothetical protein [Pandoraea sp. LA3]MDN4584600.1 hypothetical protein [Pandoraea capi]
MPVPTSIDELSTTPASNSPAGSEPVGPYANDYFQAAFAFIKQIAVGSGWKPTAAVDMNGQKITNIAAGILSPTSKDVVRGDQIFKVGEVRMYHGAVANIASVWGDGWHLCDGTNGTANLTDRFIVGAGSTYAPNATGGNANITLSMAQMPQHSHVVNDPGHKHPLVDGGHNHAIQDPGHVHGFLRGAAGANAPGGSGWSDSDYGGPIQVNTNKVGTDISIVGSGSNISMNNAVSGITLQSSGNGAAIDIRPPFYALCFIEYTGVA